MTQIVTEVSDLFVALFGILIDLLLPTGGLTPVSTLAWFGLVFPLLGGVLSFLVRLSKGGGSN